jgi:hypothetical protein
MDGSARAPMKTVPSYDNLRGGARSLRSGGRRMGIPFSQEKLPKGRGNPGNRNILVPGGKETNRDAASKGDRKRQRANRIISRKGKKMWSVESG